MIAHLLSFWLLVISMNALEQKTPLTFKSTLLTVNKGREITRSDNTMMEAVMLSITILDDVISFSLNVCFHAHVRKIVRI